MPNAKKIILSDRTILFRESLAEVLGRREGIRVVAQASGIEDTLRLIGEHAPDLVVMDWMLDGGVALEVLGALRKRGGKTRAMILTGVRAPEAVAAAFSAGACGYVLKDAGLEEFVTALETVHHGKSYLSPCLRSILKIDREGHGDLPTSRLSTLTPREREILAYICEGYTSRQIGAQIGISLRTVETHRANLRAKLNLRTVADLTAFALANDLCQR